MMNVMNKLLASTMTRIYMVMILLYVVAGLIQNEFFSLQNVVRMLVFAAILGIVSLGQTMVILTGGIDLSVAYTMTFGCVMMVTLTNRLGGFMAVLVALVIGLLIGIVNGIGVAYFKIPALIMTLAMNNILKSLTYVAYDGGGTTSDLPAFILALGRGEIFQVKNVVIFWLLLSALLIVMEKRTVFGRKLYAVGSNETVAYLSGINKYFTRISAYAICSVFAVLAGFALTGVISYPYIDMGTSYQLPSIAVVVIGGTSIMGGKGSVVGTVAGAVIIYLLTSILTIMSIPESGQNIIYGSVILCVVILYSRGKNSMALT